MAGEPPSLIDLARQAQQMRATIARLFPRGVLRDSAWDMLLELFIAAQEYRPLCVKQLILASGETSTSALRRIDRLAQLDMLQRHNDVDDHRRVSISLTHRGEEAMEAMLRSLILDRTGNRNAPRSTDGRQVN